MHAHVLHLKVAFLILHEHDLSHSTFYLGPTLEVALRVVLVQQVICVFIVDLDEGHLQLVAYLLRSLAELLEDVAQNTRNYASVLPIVPAAHCEGLA